MELRVGVHGDAEDGDGLETAGLPAGASATKGKQQEATSTGGYPWRSCLVKGKTRERGVSGNGRSKGKRKKQQGQRSSVGCADDVVGRNLIPRWEKSAGIGGWLGEGIEGDRVRGSRGIGFGGECGGG